MNIALLANPTSWHAQDLLRAAGSRHRVTTEDFRSLHARVGRNESAGIGGTPPDALLVRSMPPGSLEQVIFRMDVLARCQALGTPVVNSPKSLETAIDKYLSLSLLKNAGIRVPETRIGQSVEAALRGFEELDGDVVLKPIFGSEGRGIRRITNLASAREVFQSVIADGGVVYQQQFVDHAHEDFRILLVGPELFGMRRRNLDDWRTNSARGADCFGWQPLPREEEIARRAAEAVGAEIAGVDLLYDSQNQPFVVEVNAVPGWKAISAVTGNDVALAVFEYLENKLGVLV